MPKPASGPLSGSERKARPGRKAAGAPRNCPTADPAYPARAAARTRANEEWLKAKIAARMWAGEGRVTVVNGVDQQLRIDAPSGQVIKIWRVGDRFRLAVDDRVVGDHDPEDVLVAAMIETGGE